MSKRSLYVLLILSIVLSSLTTLSPNVYAWTAGEKPALCPTGTWDNWKADWASMKSVDGTLSTPPEIGSYYTVIHAADGYPWNTMQAAYVWNESIHAGTDAGESALYFPTNAGGGYMLNRFTDDYTIDTDIWTLYGYGNPLTLSDGRYNLCIVATSGIVSHPNYPYMGADTSWFNHNPVADSTPPAISNASMNPQLILFRGKVRFSVKAVDTQSGVSRGEFYIDTDPGKGNGTPMKLKNGKIISSTTIKNLKLGKHTLYMRAIDTAGNWSKSVSKQFIYIGFSR